MCRGFRCGPIRVPANPVSRIRSCGHSATRYWPAQWSNVPATAGSMVQRAGGDRARRPDPPLPTRAGRALDLVTRRAADAAARPARVRPARVRPARVRMPPDSSPGRSCGPTRPGSCLTCSSPDHTTGPRSSPGSSGPPHAAPRSGCRSTRSRAAVTPPPRTRGCRSSPPSAPCSTRPLPGPTRPPESSQDR